MKKVKALLYCTKGNYKNHLHKLYRENKYPYYQVDNVKGWKLEPMPLNGKIVAECDFEVEEHNETTNDWLCMSLKEKIVFGNLCEKASIDELECYKYADGKPLYALHISNLKIFDKPKQLNDYCLHEIVDKIFFNEKEIKKAPQNMCKVYDKKLTRTEKEDGYVLISIQSKWLCKILNGEKTIEARRKVLNCMKEV